MSLIPHFSILGSGPTVLMLHGIGGGHLSFAPQLEAFAAAGFRAVAWDMPGYGFSAPVEPFNFKGLAARCVALIEALQCPNVALLGHSMGGMVAQEVALRRPDLVNRLILCGTSASFARRTDGSLAVEWADRFVAQRTAPLAQGRSMEELAGELVPAMVGTQAQPEGVRMAVHCLSQVPAATYRRAVECITTFDRQGALGELTMPTLLVGGSDDKVASPEVMRTMARVIPRARYEELEGAGHLMHLELPEVFNTCVLSFLREPLVPPHGAAPGVH